jgi:hypothetical protein
VVAVGVGRRGMIRFLARQAVGDKRTGVHGKRKQTDVMKRAAMISERCSSIYVLSELPIVASSFTRTVCVCSAVHLPGDA